MRASSGIACAGGVHDVRAEWWPGRLAKLRGLAGGWATASECLRVSEPVRCVRITLRKRELTGATQLDVPRVAQDACIYGVELAEGSCAENGLGRWAYPTGAPGCARGTHLLPYETSAWVENGQHRRERVRTGLSSTHQAGSGRTFCCAYGIVEGQSSSKTSGPSMTCVPSRGREAGAGAGDSRWVLHRAGMQSVARILMGPSLGPTRGVAGEQVHGRGLCTSPAARCSSPGTNV